MQRKFRLTRSEDFQRIRKSGKSFSHPLIVLAAHPNELSQVRVGITAAKSTGIAVQRNRAKRLLREAIRPWMDSIAAGWDLVLIARPALASASLTDTRRAVGGLLQRAQLVRTNES